MRISELSVGPLVRIPYRYCDQAVRHVPDPASALDS